MPNSYWNVEWPNINSQRAYPLVSGQTQADGSFVIPNDFLVDFVLPVNVGIVPTLDITKFYISQIGVFGGGIVVSLAYNGDIIATVNIPTTGFTRGSVYPVIGVGIFFDSAGWLTIGEIDEISKSPGAWTFTQDTAKLIPTAIKPNVRTVTSFSIQNDQDVSESITGDLVFQAGQGMQLRLGVVGGKSAIIVDAITGEGFNEACDCSEVDEDAPPIRKINGIPPNASGEIIIRGTSCVAISEGEAEISIDDSCSEPCCDCRELQVITADVEELTNQMLAMTQFATKLDGEVNNLSNNLLASKTTGIP